MRPRTDRSRRRAQSRTRREKASSCVPPRAHPAPRDSDPPDFGPSLVARSERSTRHGQRDPTGLGFRSISSMYTGAHPSLALGSFCHISRLDGPPLRRAFCSSLYVWGRPRQSLSRLFPAIADDALSSREQFFCFSGCVCCACCTYVAQCSSLNDNVCSELSISTGVIFPSSS